MVCSHCPKTRPTQIARPIKMALVPFTRSVSVNTKPMPRWRLWHSSHWKEWKQIRVALEWGCNLFLSYSKVFTELTALTLALGVKGPLPRNVWGCSYCTETPSVMPLTYGHFIGLGVGQCAETIIYSGWVFNYQVWRAHKHRRFSMVPKQTLNNLPVSFTHNPMRSAILTKVSNFISGASLNRIGAKLLQKKQIQEILQSKAVADTGFSTRGRGGQPPRWGRQPITWPFFPKTTWIWKKLDGGGGVPDSPLDPPIQGGSFRWPLPIKYNDEWKYGDLFEFSPFGLLNLPILRSIKILLVFSIKIEIKPNTYI